MSSNRIYKNENILGFLTKSTLLYFVLQIGYGDSKLHVVVYEGDPNYDAYCLKQAYINEFPANLSRYASQEDGVLRTYNGDIRRVTAESRDRISKKLQKYRLEESIGFSCEECEWTENNGKYVKKWIHGTNLQKEFWYAPILKWNARDDVFIGRCYIAPSERQLHVGVPMIFEDGPTDALGRETVKWTAYGDHEDLFEFNRADEGPTPDPTP